MTGKQTVLYYATMQNATPTARCAIILPMSTARKFTLPGLDELYVVYLMILAVAFAGYLAWKTIEGAVLILIAFVETFPYASGIALLVIGTLAFLVDLRDRRDSRARRGLR